MPTNIGNIKVTWNGTEIMKAASGSFDNGTLTVPNATWSIKETHPLSWAALPNATTTPKLTLTGEEMEHSGTMGRGRADGIKGFELQRPNAKWKKTGKLKTFGGKIGKSVFSGVA
jgi:hypothetical protein